MLRAILNIQWSTHPSKERLYGNLVQITSVIKERRARFAGRCYRSKDKVVSNLILWTHKHGKAKVGRPSKTYTKQLTEDASCQPEDLSRAMEDREQWRGRVNMVMAIRPIQQDKFGADMSSSVRIDNKGKDNLILGDSATQGLDGTTLTA